MVRFLYRRILQSKWFEPFDEDHGVTGEGTSSHGILLRRPDGLYTAEPMLLNSDLVHAVERLGVAVAFTMSSEITRSLLQQVTPFQTELSLDPRGFSLPIVNSVRDLGTEKCSVKSDDYICLCRNEKLVLVWGDSAEGILAHGTDVETKILGLVCLLSVFFLVFGFLLFTFIIIFISTNNC